MKIYAATVTFPYEGEQFGGFFLTREEAEAQLPRMKQYYRGEGYNEYYVWEIEVDKVLDL